MSADVVGLFWGQTASPLKAVFKTCTPGAPGCGWGAGDMLTHSQNSYGTSTAAGAALLGIRFGSVYPSGLIVGGTNTMSFSSAAALVNYLPATGTPSGLTAILNNPLTSSSGQLGGEVAALQLNVDFSDAGWLTSAVPLGTLYFCNFTAVPQLNGQTVEQFLTTANWVLGGRSASLSADHISAVANAVNNAFAGGAPSAFAQSSLQAGTCVN